MDYKKEFPIGTKVEITGRIMGHEEYTPGMGVVDSHDTSDEFPFVSIGGHIVDFYSGELKYIKKIDEFEPKLGDEIEYRFTGYAWHPGFYIGKFGSRYIVTKSKSVITDGCDFISFHVDEIRPITKQKGYTMEELAKLAGVPLKDFRIEGER